MNMAQNLPTPVTVEQVRQIAKQKLPEPVWRYYEDGADDQITTRRNREVYNE
jgi:(S)-2-hydroxy-acid oxidase